MGVFALYVHCPHERSESDKNINTVDPLKTPYTPYTLPFDYIAIFFETSCH